MANGYRDDVSRNVVRQSSDHWSFWQHSSTGVCLSGGASRSLATPATVAAGQEMWISFLGDLGGGDTTSIDFGSILRFQSDHGAPWRMSVGLGGGSVSLFTVNPYDIRFYVVRFQVSGSAGGSATLWVDPTPGLQMPDIDPTATVNFTGVLVQPESELPIAGVDDNGVRGGFNSVGSVAPNSGEGTDGVRAAAWRASRRRSRAASSLRSRAAWMAAWRPAR